MSAGVRAAFVCAVSLAAGLLPAGCAGEGPEDGTLSPSPIENVPVQKSGRVQEFTLVLTDAPHPPPDLTVSTFEDGGYLAGPHFGLRLSWVATGPELSQVGMPLGTELTPRRAPMGHQLMLIAVDPQVRAGQWTLGERSRPRAELVIGERVTRLQTLPLPSTASPVETDTAVVLASVPGDAPVRLRVTDEGRTQTLDVRTGKRGEDAIDGYYRPNHKKLAAPENSKADAGVSVLGGRDFVDTSFGMDFTGIGVVAGTARVPAAMLAPYAPGKGWARPGRAWLVLAPPRVSLDREQDDPLLTLIARDAEVFPIRLPDGTTIEETGGQRKFETYQGAFGEAEDLIYDVPADFQRGTLVIDLARTSVVAEYREGKLPGSWAPAPEPWEVPFRFD